MAKPQKEQIRQCLQEKARQMHSYNIYSSMPESNYNMVLDLPVFGKQSSW